jgi:hypothetical protein
MDLWESAGRELCAKKGIFESNLSLSVKGVEDGSLGDCWEGVMRQKGIVESNLSLSVKGVEDGSLGDCWEGVMRQLGSASNNPRKYRFTDLLRSLAGRYDNSIPTRFHSPHRLFKNSSRFFSFSYTLPFWLHMDLHTRKFELIHARIRIYCRIGSRF